MRNIAAAAITACFTTIILGCDAQSPGTTSSAITPISIDCPSARIVASTADLVSGPLARGSLNDLVIENTQLRAVIQKPGRNWFGVGPFGGNIIDAVPRNADGSITAEDHFEELSLGTNIESSPNYQTVEVLQAGGADALGNCLPAIVRATGPDDLIDFMNASSIIRDLGFQFPASADDVNLQATMQTDYILEPNSKFITMTTSLISESATDQDIYMVEYLSGSGEVEFFQHGYGFGEPLISHPCDSCRGGIYSGHEGGSGVSYGILNNIQTSSALSTSGVSVLVYGTDAVNIALGTATPPFTIPANGTLEITRYFAVGDGSVASILDIQHEILGTATGELSGTVTDANGPVEDAEIAVITTNNDFDPLLGLTPRGPSTLVANHFRTDENGQYSGNLPLGSYELRINVPGRLAPTPATTNVTIAAAAPVVQDFVAPLAAQVRVRVRDENGQAIAAKVQLIGSDVSPDANEPQNSEDTGVPPILTLLSTETGIFGDGDADHMPAGVVFTEFAVNDPNLTGTVTVGDTGAFDIEPGTYELSVSHGPRYSEHRETVTLVAGQTLDITRSLAQVVTTPGIVFGDFHVHSFSSPDSEVHDRQRIATYLAEGMDFFTPSDHGRRNDFEPVIANMGVGNIIASAPSAEMTTFDYGHINAWPVGIDISPASDDEPSQSSDLKLSQGAVDWGGAAPAGFDFPSEGNYSMAPAAIFADAKSEPYHTGREVVVQLNHLETHFGSDGLQIDTGVVPPTSAQDPTTRRLDPASGNLFDTTIGFDTLELWIGVDGRPHQADPASAEPGHLFSENLGDWFNMINQGITPTFVANSDTHERRMTSMSTRNWIYAQPSQISGGEANISALRSDPHSLGDEVREGRTVASNALFLEVDIETNGNTGGLSQAYPNGVVSSPVVGSGDVTINVSIQAPTWAEYDLIEVYLNTHTQSHNDGLQVTTPARYNICAAETTLALADADFTRSETVIATTNDGSGPITHSRFSTNASITLTPPANDYWIVVIARGQDGVSRPMWPVVGNDFTDSGDGLTTRSAADLGMTAMAISNPIFVSVDGNDTWESPRTVAETMTHTGLNLPPDLCPGATPTLPPIPPLPLPFP